MSNLGNVLRREREARGLSRPELARQTGLSPTTIRAIELNKRGRRPEARTLEALVTALDLPRETLIEEIRATRPPANVSPVHHAWKRQRTMGESLETGVESLDSKQTPLARDQVRALEMIQLAGEGQAHIATIVRWMAEHLTTLYGTSPSGEEERRVVATALIAAGISYNESFDLETGRRLHDQARKLVRSIDPYLVGFATLAMAELYRKEADQTHDASLRQQAHRWLESIIGDVLFTSLQRQALVEKAKVALGRNDETGFWSTLSEAERVGENLNGETGYLVEHGIVFLEDTRLRGLGRFGGLDRDNLLTRIRQTRKVMEAHPSGYSAVIRESTTPYAIAQALMTHKNEEGAKVAIAQWASGLRSARDLGFARQVHYGMQIGQRFAANFPNTFVWLHDYPCGGCSHRPPLARYNSDMGQFYCRYCRCVVLSLRW